MWNTDLFGKGTFKIGDVPTSYKRGLGNNGGDRRIDFLLNCQILGVEIDKLHGPSFPPELWGVPLS